MSLPDTITVDGVRYRRLDRRPNKVSCWAMYDCHAFTRLRGTTVDELIDHWKRLCDKPDEYGQPSLCPIIVMEDDKEIRRVGEMVFPHDGYRSKAKIADDISRFRQEALADPDISRLLAATAETVTEVRK